MRKVFGIHNAMAMLQHRPGEIELIHLSERRGDKRVGQIEKLAAEQGIPFERVSVDVLKTLAEKNRHQGVVMLCRSTNKPKQSNLSDWFDGLANKSLIVVLDSVVDPRNLGACIRSANAAGAGGIVVSRSRGSPLTATVSQVAAGAAEITPIFRAANLARSLDELKKKELWIVGLDASAAQPIYSIDLTEPCALVFGAEESGLREQTRKQCDFLAAIPMLGGVASINVSVAVGVVAFETVRQRSFESPPNGDPG